MSSSNPKQPPRTEWLTRFGRGFSASRWLRADDGLQRLSEGANGQEWILARGLCAFTVLDGAAVPPRKRRGFAQMAVARWAPFPDPQSHVEWSGDRAMVWAWSRARVMEGSDGASLPIPRSIRPESLFRGEPTAEGEQLVAMASGFEARVWRDGAMLASSWWPELPDLPEWNEFRRGAGLAPAPALPAPVHPPLAERAWSAAARAGLGEALGHYRAYGVAAAMGVACAFLAALLVGNAALRLSIWQLDRDIASREQALERIIDARDRALEGQRLVAAELSLRPNAGQVELMSLMNDRLRGAWQLEEWKLVDAENLQISVRMNNPDPSAIIRSLEASGRFADVTADLARQANVVVVKARVLPAKAPKSGGGKR